MGDVGMVLAEGRFPDGERALVERLGPPVQPLVAVEDGEVVERLGDVGMVLAEGRFPNGERALVGAARPGPGPPAADECLPAGAGSWRRPAWVSPSTASLSASARSACARAAGNGSRLAASSASSKAVCASCSRGSRRRLRCRCACCPAERTTVIHRNTRFMATPLVGRERGADAHADPRVARRRICRGEMFALYAVKAS